MNNFEFCCPTNVIFGKGTISRLSDLIPKDKKILMTYGGGSIKKNGVYEQVKKALKSHNVIEFGGIEPNPEYETLMKAVKIVKEENIDFLLSVGGGSTLDGTKFIAVAAKYNGDCAYDIVKKGISLTECVELGDVITLPATGSEMNGGYVISRRATGEKFGNITQSTIPKFSIIDPEVTYSLPTKQTINGIVDTFVHVMEQYCTYDVNTPLQDGWALTILKTLIQEAPKVLENPNDYETRANIFWCATCGLNNWLSVGCVQDWATHMIGHELTAIYGIDHGQSLAIVMPRLLKNQIENKKDKLVKIAKDVFNYQNEDKNLSANYAIDSIYNFFESIGVKMSLSDYNINSDEAANEIYNRFKERGTILGERGVINADIALEIVKKC